MLSGVSSIATGLMFDIHVPMAVQPMKSIAAVALAANSDDEFSIDCMLAAGMITAWDNALYDDPNPLWCVASSACT